MAAPTVCGSLKSPRLLLDSFCLSRELLHLFSIASPLARAGVLLAERKPSCTEAATPNRQHRRTWKARAEEMRSGNLDTEDEDLLLVSPERGLLSSRSSSLPRLDRRCMEHHQV